MTAKVQQVMIGGDWATITSRESFEEYQSKGYATRILPLSAFSKKERPDREYPAMFKRGELVRLLFSWPDTAGNGDGLSSMWVGRLMREAATHIGDQLRREAVEDVASSDYCSPIIAEQLRDMAGAFDRAVLENRKAGLADATPKNLLPGEIAP